MRRPYEVSSAFHVPDFPSLYGNRISSFCGGLRYPWTRKGVGNMQHYSLCGYFLLTSRYGDSIIVVASCKAMRRAANTCRLRTGGRTGESSFVPTMEREKPWPSKRPVTTACMRSSIWPCGRGRFNRCSRPDRVPNQPDFPGQLKDCPIGRVCKNFRARPPTPKGETVKTIPLGDGFYACVDAADFEWLDQWTWSLVNGYAARRTTITSGSTCTARS